MSLFRRKKTLTFRQCEGSGFDVEVVGEASYQETLRRLARATGKPTQRFEVAVYLRPEPKNKHDPNAVAVVALDGSQLGYLSQQQAEVSRAHLQRFISRHNALPSCRGVVFGGQHTPPNYGMALNIGMEAIGDVVLRM
jgi:hypothetical protein